MGERTGLGYVEAAVVCAVARASLRPDAVFERCQRILEVCQADWDVAPRLAYDVLCGMSWPDQVPLTLIEPHGNLGTLDDPPADPRYTEARLTPVGLMAVAAERGEGPALPLGLINGDVWLDGSRPPLRPEGVLDALDALADEPGLDDAAVLEVVGAPAFPTGCLVEGDVCGLLRGERVELRLEPVLRLDHAAGTIRLEHLPHGLGGWTLASILGRDEGAVEDDLGDAVDGLTRIEVGRSGPGPRSRAEAMDPRRGHRVICHVEAGRELDELAASLLARDGVTVEIHARWGAPLADVLRDWVARFADEDLRTGLTRLRAVV